LFLDESRNALVGALALRNQGYIDHSHLVNLLSICENEIPSEYAEEHYRHEYVQCSCGKVAVDGGHDYLRRSYSGNRDDYTDLSEYEEVEEKQDD
ncbi:MAG: hypothetical protein MR842_00310, partial [Clostridiales bacterium]|nr:hypothetical protein [Clostridiales bacterium]MDY4007906.1 hypothetical protein [Candidatus Limiplasma sp.]